MTKRYRRRRTLTSVYREPVRAAEPPPRHDSLARIVVTLVLLWLATAATMVFLPLEIMVAAYNCADGNRTGLCNPGVQGVGISGAFLALPALAGLATGGVASRDQRTRRLAAQGWFGGLVGVWATFVLLAAHPWHR
ncbi:hypothetical protein [Yinghuangia seranimata]|uniref:hypothetical protein n=1 Tax=Yinghuangia seranimata TaxID=408067 RepID=UPI00248C9F06|nr:hypothetical protein [Yinghuangia seranimata]MDI2132138.1 hypothetical protein [Yinghuangia seranimata]